jgi:rhodanese-related sulfurtransferase
VFRHAHAPIPEIDVAELETLRAAGETEVLDVREGWEYRQARVPGVIHIPLGELVARVDEVPRDRRVVVICGHGSRSLSAAEFLLQRGYEGVASVAGGTTAWAASGREIETGD